MMAARLMVVVTLLTSAAVLVSGSAVAEPKTALDRPGIVDLDEPVLIDRDALRREMRLNVNLAEYIDLYGYPDYVEIQEVALQEPFAPYEVRLYYLKQNNYLAYGRVHIAPIIDDFGVRKFEGPIPAATLNRLLTASLERARQEAAAREAAMAPPVEEVEVEVVMPEGETMEAPAEAPVVIEESPEVVPAGEPAPGDGSSDAAIPEDTLS